MQIKVRDSLVHLIKFEVSPIHWWLWRKRSSAYRNNFLVSRGPRLGPYDAERCQPLGLASPDCCKICDFSVKDIFVVSVWNAFNFVLVLFCCIITTKKRVNVRWILMIVALRDLFSQQLIYCILHVTRVIYIYIIDFYICIIDTESNIFFKYPGIWISVQNN